MPVLKVMKIQLFRQDVPEIQASHKQTKINKIKHVKQLSNIMYPKCLARRVKKIYTTPRLFKAVLQSIYQKSDSNKWAHQQISKSMDWGH